MPLIVKKEYIVNGGHLTICKGVSLHWLTSAIN